MKKSGFWPGILTVLSSIIPNMFRKVRFRLSFRRPKTSALIRSGRTNIWKTCWFPERLCAGQNILWPCSAKPETVQVLTDVSSVVCMQIHFICILTAKGLFILTGCWTTTTGFLPTALTALWRLRLSVWAEKCLKRKSRSGAIFPTAKSKISAGSDIMLPKTAGNV